MREQGFVVRLIGDRAVQVTIGWVWRLSIGERAVIEEQAQVGELGPVSWKACFAVSALVEQHVMRSPISLAPDSPPEEPLRQWFEQD